MSSKTGVHGTKTRSQRPKWLTIGNYFYSMCNIWKTVSASLTINMEQYICDFRGEGYAVKLINLTKFKMADLRQLLTFI